MARLRRNRTIWRQARELTRWVLRLEGVVLSSLIAIALSGCSQGTKPPPVQRWGLDTGAVSVTDSRAGQPDQGELDWTTRDLETAWQRTVDGATLMLTSPPLPFATGEDVGVVEIEVGAGASAVELEVMWSDTDRPDAKELLTGRLVAMVGTDQGPTFVRLSGAQLANVRFAEEERPRRHLFLRFPAESLDLRSVKILPRSALPAEFQPISLGGVIREAVVLRPPASVATGTTVAAGSCLRFSLASNRPSSVEVAVTMTGREGIGASESTVVRRLDLDRRWSSLDIPIAVKGDAELRIELGSGKRTPIYCSRPMILRPDSVRSPNVVLYVIDALRASDLGCYGSARRTSPFLDRLASRGVLFESCTADCSWTKPSVASLLTSLSPQVHGLGGHSHADALPATVPTLQRAMSEAGYVTASFSANPLASNLSNLHVGFDEAMTPAAFARRVPPGKVGSEELSTALIGWMENHREHPFFAYVHSMDPHGPLTEWTTPADLGDGESRSRVNYLREIFHNDREIERVYGWLETHGLYRNTLFVVTADHGEAFDEHGNRGHGNSTFQEEVHIPLIAVHPGRLEPHRTARPVQLVDLMPTILEQCGIDLDIPASRGIDVLDPSSDAPGRPVFSTRFAYPLDPRLWDVPYVETYAVTDGRWKLVVRGTPPNEDLHLELYDLDSDPWETDDLGQVEPATVTRLLAELSRNLDQQASLRDRFVALHLRGAQAVGVALSSREREELEALGYQVERK